MNGNTPPPSDDRDSSARTEPADPATLLRAAWENPARIPALADFLPNDSQLECRRVLLALIPIDQEQRLRHGLTLRPIEDYQAEFAHLFPEGVPSALLHAEMDLRREHGEAAPLDEYQRRFPEHAAALGRPGGRDTPSTSDSSPLEALAVGQVIDDFELKSPLGRGGLARVFLAWQRSMHRLVALKISAARGDESRALAQLDHPYIVRVFDQRELEASGLRLLYMAYIPGGTLEDLLTLSRQRPRGELSGAVLLESIDRMLRARGEALPPPSATRAAIARLSWPRVVAFLGGCLARALDYSHRQGVLHRDIKPANILLDAEGQPRLADFNIGFNTRLPESSTRACFGGTLPYMAPEQIDAFNPRHERRAESLDARGDLFALGVTLWELLTGELPFARSESPARPGETLERLSTLRRQGPARPLPPDTPPALARVLHRCLRAEPEERPASGAVVARALEACQHEDAARLLDPPAGTWQAWARRHPLAALLAAGLVPNILAGGFNYVYNLREVILPSGEPALNAAFERIQLLINLIFFPLGVLVFILIAQPLLRALWAVRQGQRLDAEVRARARRQATRLGILGVWISVVFWMAAGAAYPWSLGTSVGALEPALMRELTVHFLASLTLCGMIAAVYPFFLGSTLAIGSLYPALIQPEDDLRGDAGALERLRLRIWPYLTLAAAVPMAGVAVLAWVHNLEPWVIGSLSLVGQLGLGMAVALARRLQADLDALQPLLAPDSEMAGPWVMSLRNR